MMRVKMTEEQKLSPVAHLASLYAGDLVSAGLGFSTACYQHSKLSLREFEGARVRTAQINGCEVCQNWRSERDLPGYFAAFDGDYANSVAAHGRAPDDAFYGAIAGWRTADMFTPRERLAIEYAEGLGRDPHGIAQDEDFWKRLKASFSDEEVVDLSYCIAAWMGVGRVTHALGMDSVCQLNLTAVAA
jgi:alkylhydroperoxidase family enzyme